MKRPTVVVKRDILQSWLVVSEYTKSRLAEKLEVTKGRVSQLFRTPTEPSAHLMAKLMLVTGLPFDRLFRVTASRGTSSRVKRGQRTKRNGSHDSAARATRRKPQADPVMAVASMPAALDA